MATQVDSLNDTNYNALMNYSEGMMEMRALTLVMAKFVYLVEEMSCGRERVVAEIRTVISRNYVNRRISLKM